MLSSLKDTKSPKYAMYYSTILAIASIVVILTSLKLINLSIIEGIALFFEGFFALFMLVRHEEVGSGLLTNLSYWKGFLQLKLSFS